MNKKNKYKIAFFGKTGSGKSSLMNSIFNTNFGTDNVVACTKELQFFEDEKVIAMDTPGIGEEIISDEDYFPIYKKALNSANLIFWVFQADTRVYKTDQLALIKFEPEIKEKTKFIILLNQVDLIGFGDWDKTFNAPSNEQNKWIDEKALDLKIKLGKYIPANQTEVVPVSAIHGYNISKIKKNIYEYANGFN